MATTESMPRSAFPTDHISPHQKSIPILSSTSASPRVQLPSTISEPDPMDITPTNNMSMPPPTSSPPNERHSDKSTNSDEGIPTTNGNMNGHQMTVSVGAAAAAQQPKVVQTAFIHKLYNMLEDQSIQHLISWSSSNDSFVMSPSQEFAKVLAQYFKHTNISSFVRQLNMYGFHKAVSDVFHNGAPDSTLWEFRHGNGSFKRGDIMGLREIKRRASRHTLINRDTFPTGPKSLAPAHPQTPIGVTHQEQPTHTTLEDRLSLLEHTYYDVHARLGRSEDTLVYMTNKCHILSDGLMRCHQWNQDLATYLTTVISDPESQIHKDIAMMQREIARQTDVLRSVESPDPSPQEASRPTFGQPQHQIFGNHLQENGAPLSPRQMPAPDINQRRPSQPTILEPRGQQSGSFRAPIASHLSISPRRYGSIGSNNSYSPSSGRIPPPPPPPALIQPPPQHPLATVTSPPANLSRRHTSADIRLHGWQGGPTDIPTGSPYASGHTSSAWPSSPARGPVADHEIRQTLANYEIRGPSSTKTPPPGSLDPIAAVAGTGPESAWAVPGSRFPGFAKSFGSGFDSGGPPTRRSSMASNLHGLLNPAGDTVIEEEMGDNGGSKRKRVM
ncbi:hypothetical protein BT63DRAFT_110374 [Microthyrium microscopicum]|uniref:HSF-type DNA-binding domain-containing protein n=1 Tax=Microthyrium microscopicum TaxID=703497 RepID=A0A6A6TYH0_9PEZI|nr:hypothetical protein BT63DRAFT_110374 [Microthyrium microscopicum]